jgi:acyl carrier protein
MEERLRAIMADVLNVDANSIYPETSRVNNGAWDSLSHINLVVALEQEFGISFDIEEIENMISFENVIQMVQTKASAL